MHADMSKGCSRQTGLQLLVPTTGCIWAYVRIPCHELLQSDCLQQPIEHISLALRPCAGIWACCACSMAMLYREGPHQGHAYTQCVLMR